MAKFTLKDLSPKVGDFKPPFDPLLEMLRGANIKPFTLKELEDLRDRLINSLSDTEKSEK